MKKIVFIIIVTQLLLIIPQSCLVLVEKDNGKHKGWYKKHPSKKSPQHPSNSNPGKNKKLK
jgi:uncharacterized protein YxeA